MTWHNTLSSEAKPKSAQPLDLRPPCELNTPPFGLRSAELGWPAAPTASVIRENHACAGIATPADWPSAASRGAASQRRWTGARMGPAGSRNQEIIFHGLTERRNIPTLEIAAITHLRGSKAAIETSEFDAMRSGAIYATAPNAPESGGHIEGADVIFSMDARWLRFDGVVMPYPGWLVCCANRLDRSSGLEEPTPIGCRWFLPDPLLSRLQGVEACRSDAG